MSAASWPAIEVAGLTVGVREGVLLLIVVVAIYMIFVFWRMRHVLFPQAKPAVVESSGGPSEPVAPHLASTPAAPVPDEPPLTYRPEAPVFADPPPRRAAPVEPLVASGELMILREEVAVLRAELASLRADMQHELAVLRAAQTVSPIYGDAMQLAISGYGPEQIAERCGIARAEAELVAALARSRDEGAR